MVDPDSSEGGTEENTPSTPTEPRQDPDIQDLGPRAERKEPGRRQPLKWPKANEAALWQQLDKDLSIILQYSLRGQVESKLNSTGDILYEDCRSRFGVVAGKRSHGTKQKGRREMEIEMLVRRRRHLRKQWRKASVEEKEGLKPLWEEVKKSIASLRRAERIRRRTRRKEKERSSFFKNPYQHARRLLEDKRKNQVIPSEWQRAVTVFIPKEANSTTIGQFRSIALLNVEGKIFFSILAKRVTSYLVSNGYIDTSCQKAGVPGFPGCVEHSAVIWEQIQRAKRERSDLHVVWLDLANAYGSVPHSLIDYALEFFYIPVCIRAMVSRYFADLQMCCTHQNFTTSWQRQEVGIAMGCSISPILFVAAFEVILIGARKMAGGVKLPSGQRLPPVRGYMDDITTILQTAACTARLLKRSDELVAWARMKIKPTKSRSLSLRKGVRSDRTIFVAGGEEIPLLATQPVRSLGRTYTADLSDKQMGEAVRKQLADGLAKISESQLPGKYKVWSYQFILYPRVMWPLKMCEVPSSVADKMDRLANSFIKKWLGLPRCLSDVGLFGRNMLQLPLRSISQGYRQEKARLVLELRESTDQLVRAAGSQVRTGRKWKAQEEVDRAISRLKHREVIGRVQEGRAGLGRSETPLFWSRASKEQRRAMVVAEVARTEQDRLRVKAVSQSRQGNEELKRLWMGHTQCVSKSTETEPVTLRRDWRIKFRPFARLASERRSVSSQTAHMIIPNPASNKSLTVVRPKSQRGRQQLDPAVDAEGFERAMLHLNESGWYWGPLTAAEATQVLDRAHEGTFLLRKSSNPGYLLTLSLRTSLGPTHLRIEYANGKFGFDSAAVARPQLRQFKDAVELVQHYALAYQKVASPKDRNACSTDEADDTALSVTSETLQLKLTRPLHRRPCSLQHLCRKAINQYSHIHENLPLPERLKDFLLEYPFLL
ncbi:hypothetical protein ACEWY4_001081 [Coilia grayii]|uniref:Suppressor of cytokine signaling 2 n=1 Tax=Coilia grayii TaxID=363190 RepID=A0ABD1KYI3_9TELE